MVPSDWSKKKLSSVASTATGGTPNRKKPEYFGGNIPWVKSGELNDGRISETEEHITLAGLKTSSAKLFPPGTLLVALYGATVGKTALLNIEAATNQAICAVFGDGNLDIEYLRYFIIHIRPELLAQRYGGAQPNISQTILRNIEVTLPPLPEQRRIAAVLAQVQRAIEQQKRLIGLTTELKKALMHKLFTEGTRGEPQKQTEIGPIPESWEVVKLKDTVEYIDYGLSKAIPKTPPPKGVNIVSTADITRDGELLYRKIRTTDAPAKTVARLTLRDGDVLFNWRNSAELIGKTTIYDEQPEPHIFASFILRLRCDEVKSHNFYLKHLMNHWRERGVFIKLARRAVNQANYNKNEISVLKIPQPDYDEQVEIAETIRVVEDRIGSLVNTRNCFQNLFRTLLHQLMTAEIRVNDLDLEELGIELQE